MKSLIVALGITFAVLLAVPASDAAASGDGYRSHQGHHHQSAAGGAILLLAGGMLCLVSRRREDELA
jgi:hypothetical protein